MAEATVPVGARYVGVRLVVPNGQTVPIFPGMGSASFQLETWRDPSLTPAIDPVGFNSGGFPLQPGGNAVPFAALTGSPRSCGDSKWYWVSAMDSAEEFGVTQDVQFSQENACYANIAQ
jgi:hypothetical protein